MCYMSIRYIPYQIYIKVLDITSNVNTASENVNFLETRLLNKVYGYSIHEKCMRKCFKIDLGYRPHHMQRY